MCMQSCRCHPPFYGSEFALDGAHALRNVPASHEPVDEPLQLLERAAKAAGIEDRVLVLEEGVTQFF